MQPKPKPRLLATLLATIALLLALPLTALASELDKGMGYIPINKEPYIVSSTNKLSLQKADPGQELPSTYRSDTQVWAEGIRVKDQRRTSLCWAFAPSTAAQYSYAKEVYEATGEVGVVEEISPTHFGQFFFNRVDDPLNNTTGDFNGIPSGEAWALYGGNTMLLVQHLATWSGATLESKAPQNEIDKHIFNTNTYHDIWDGSTEQVYSASLAYDDYLTLQESIVLMVPNQDEIKALVYNYGAASVSIDMNYEECMNRDEIDPETGEPYPYGRSFYDYKEDFGRNHAVTIIGWDDNYPKENFAHKIEGMSDEEAYKLTTPQHDGAFIIQNSWGEDIHENGFFYMSYDSMELNDTHCEVIALDMQAADTYYYNFQYDGTGCTYDSSDTYTDGSHFEYYTKPGTRAANVYTNTTDDCISIGAVGFTTYNYGESPYEIDVYTNLTDMDDPTSGTLASCTHTSTYYPGTKQAELDEAVIVRPGETFSVVFSFTEFNAFGVEIPILGKYYTFEAELEPGQSFFSASQKSGWTDMYEYDACFRIKALANVVEEEFFEPNSIVNIDGVWTKTDADGRPDYSYTDFAKNQYGWWYVENGVVTFTKTGFVQNMYGWWYVEKSYVSLKKTGLIQGGDAWWYVENSRINLSKNGIVQNQYGYWIVQKGRVNFNYYGTITAAGVRWKVSAGRIVGRA